MAEEYRDLFDLPESVMQLDPAQMAAEEAIRQAKYLQLPFPTDNLIMVDSRYLMKRELIQQTTVKW